MKTKQILLCFGLATSCLAVASDRYLTSLAWPSSPKGHNIFQHHFTTVANDQSWYRTGWFTDTAMPTATITPVYSLQVFPGTAHTAIGAKLYVKLKVEVSISGPQGASGQLSLAPKPGEKGYTGKSSVALAKMDSVQEAVGRSVSLQGVDPKFVLVGEQVIPTTLQETFGRNIQANLTLHLGKLSLSGGARGEYRITVESVSLQAPVVGEPIP